ncbi:MAG: hypothetical protein PHG24_02280 [Candidatus Pacebacteria bacterium]|nr:hypothetical protein [Candidatus Paceibacterota bacterium]
MKKNFDKKESIFVLVIISVFSLIVLSFSVNIISKTKDLILQANLSAINTLILENYLQKNHFPKENNCNIKNDCFVLKKEILTLYSEDDIYYNSDGENYVLYTQSFTDGKIFFVTGSDLTIDRVFIIPEL